MPAGGSGRVPGIAVTDSPPRCASTAAMMPFAGFDGGLPLPLMEEIRQHQAELRAHNRAALRGDGMTFVDDGSAESRGDVADWMAGESKSKWEQVRAARGREGRGGRGCLLAATADIARGLGLGRNRKGLGVEGWGALTG